MTWGDRMMASSNRRHDPHAMTCSTCGRRFLIDETPAPPVCSERCQLIDLGRWLDEDIGLPHEGDPGESPVEFREEPDAEEPRADERRVDEPRTDERRGTLPRGSVPRGSRTTSPSPSRRQR